MVITRGNTAVAYQKPRVQEPHVQGRVWKQRRLRLSPMAVYGIVLALVVLTALLYLSQYALLAHLNLQISSMKGRIETLEREKRDLERQAAYLASLERIERVAREELGMIPCQEVRYLAVADSPAPVHGPEPQAGEAEEGETAARLAGWLLPKKAHAGSPGR
ncbi:MAG TPA: hypothetical protein GX518_02575 [Firmicutes bacterium]|nr:hypothetical protein [Bacillota bacterium]